MGVYPSAIYEPVHDRDSGPMVRHFGAVLHVNQSNGPDLYEWFSGSHNVSSHFQVADNGVVYQYLDTDLQSWCQEAGNAEWVSIETEGFNTQPLTPQQITACAGIMRWLHAEHGIPLTLTDQVSIPGFGWHGMGGQAWGGHLDCPGDARRADRAAILVMARGPVPIPPPHSAQSDTGETMILLGTPSGKRGALQPTGIYEYSPSEWAGILKIRGTLPAATRTAAMPYVVIPDASWNEFEVTKR